MREHSEMVFDKGYLLPEENFINDNEFLGSVVQRYLPNRKYRRNASMKGDSEQSMVQSVLFEYGESYAVAADSGERSQHFDGRASGQKSAAEQAANAAMAAGGFKEVDTETLSAFERQFLAAQKKAEAQEEAYIKESAEREAEIQKQMQVQYYTWDTILDGVCGV
jgi:hypothetical protein